VPLDRAERVVKRLMASDMWSGWGIRTLSSAHKSFNPYAYQLGRFGPTTMDSSRGFKRYGFHDEAAQVARAISGAASYFQGNQLPELFAGIRKEDNNFPVQYLGANVPQAWAGGLSVWVVESHPRLSAGCSAESTVCRPCSSRMVA